MAEHRALYVAEFGDQSEPFATAGLTDEGALVVEDLDLDRGVAEAFRVENFDLQRHTGRSWNSVISAEDIKMDVFITASRIAFWAPKYDKGQSWVGWGPAGIAVAVAATAISRARAARLTRGTALIGHIRYEWLSDVGFKRKTGFFSSECVRFIYKDSDKTLWALDLVLSKRLNAGLVAQQVASLAAKYRLCMQDDKTAEETADLQKLIGARMPVNGPKEFALYSFPTYYNAPFGGRNKRPELSALTAAQRTPIPAGVRPADAPTPPPTASAVSTTVAEPSLENMAPIRSPHDAGGVTMPFCPACGERTEEGSMFCTLCRTPVTVAQDAALGAPVLREASGGIGGQIQVPEPTTCTACGMAAEEGEAFCVGCGMPAATGLPTERMVTT
ncbi:MAG: zinc ribbon domain-containing protein [Bifidobacteriaceae bacterium]|jgi:hypothetical protein|nr:zinc ribbon domain-containing protein [Bifidobacteriaceae bacterium]